MKKILLFFILVFSFVCFVGCTTLEPVPENEAPVITVEPATVEMYAEEEIDLLFGVSATDDSDLKVNVIVSDDGGFDNETPGTYTITYKATDSGDKVATAKRTIIVNKAKSALALEVRENKLGETKWQGKTISFKNNLYVELTESTTLEKQSGVFHNNTTGEITLTVAGGYGCAAVLDANGVVIEGRDGANSRLMNEDNPTRSSGASKLDAETTVASAFAKDLVIPANGYAVIIQASYAGTTADSDGRSFMNYNVIYQYGNVVRLYWVDTETTITPYVNQGPTVSGNSTVYVAIGDKNANVESLVKAGLTAKDDNGTFDIADDVKVTEFAVTDNGGYDVTKAGEYTFTLTCTDGEKTTTFTRVVSVLPAEKCASVTIGANTHNFLADNIAIDKDLTSVGNYSYIYYSKDYKLPQGTETLGYTNGYGVAMLLNEYGEIVIIYDGANAKYYDADNNATTGIVNATTYLVDAFAKAQEKGYGVLIAPNSTANNAEGGSRKFLLDNRTVGAKVAITGVTFADRTYTFAINGKEFSAVEEKVLVNEVTTKAASYKMLIYTKDCEAASITCNGWGVAVVLDKYGTLVRVYDGISAKLYDAENTSGKSDGFTSTDFANYAYTKLADGETLIIFPNDGDNKEGSPRAFAYGLRTDGSIGKIATLSNFEFAIEQLEFSVNGKTYTAEKGKYVIDTVVTAAQAASYKMLVYTKACEASAITCNGYGAAVVIDKYGTLVRIYDGANAKYFDAENTSGIAASGFGQADYATYAYTQLQDGETLVIFPHNGAAADANPRTFGLGLRNANDIGKEVTLTDFTWATKAPEKMFKIGANTFTKDGEIKVAVNDNTATYSSHDFCVYTSSFNGTLGVANGYGIAIVVSDGKIVRIYDGTSGKYYDSENTSGVQDGTCTTNGYLKEAIASLKANEYVICAPHDGGANIARGFLNSNKVIGADVVFTLEEVTPAAVDQKYIVLDGAYFFGANVEVNTCPSNLSTLDFVIYTYGYTGQVLKNGWSECFVFDYVKGGVYRIYDGFNGKYYDGDNNGVAAGTFYTVAQASIDAFNSLQPCEVLIIGLNGGANSAKGRKFLVDHRKLDAAIELNGIDVSSVKNEEVEYKMITLDGCYYAFTGTYAVDEKPSGIPEIIVYNYGYQGELISNGYGEAFVVNKTTGKVVRIYDGASGKYYDADNDGVQNGTCTATGYITEAFNSLQEGEYVVIAPNGGSTGNATRGFFYNHRKVGISIVIPTIDK